MILQSFLDMKCCAIWYPQILGPFVYSFLSCLSVILYKHSGPDRKPTVKLVLCVVVITSV